MENYEVFVTWENSEGKNSETVANFRNEELKAVLDYIYASFDGVYVKTIAIVRKQD